jgi:hypothetical protein
VYTESKPKGSIPVMSHIRVTPSKVYHASTAEKLVCKDMYDTNPNPLFHVSVIANRTALKEYQCLNDDVRVYTASVSSITSPAATSSQLDQAV